MGKGDRGSQMRKGDRDRDEDRQMKRPFFRGQDKTREKENDGAPRKDKEVTWRSELSR